MQANALWPQRSKASDGTTASSAHHAQNPDSDHEPGARDLVHAGDLTNDPAHGCDCNVLVRQIVKRRDPRVRYLIFNKTIWRSYDRPATSTRPFLPAWRPEAYTGSNPHDKHLHNSILSTVAAEQDVSPWFRGGEVPAIMKVPNYWKSLGAPNGGVWHFAKDGGVFTDRLHANGPAAPYLGSVPEAGGADLGPGLMLLDVVADRGGYAFVVGRKTSDEVTYFNFPA